MLLLPVDSPAWVFEACTKTPYPTVLLRTSGEVTPTLLLRFPLILDPQELPASGEKKDLAVLSPHYTWIQWAKDQGLRAVWLNPQGNPCPAVHPLHDLEVRELSDLTTPLRFPYPDLAESLEILRNHGVPENVVRHSAAVAGVAHFLGKKLREKDIPVDLLLVHRGGLLHDLDKLQSAQENSVHGEEAAQILSDLGYPALGEIARRHVLRPGQGPRTWEEKLVFYADKIVEEDEVVGLEGRLRELRARYPRFHGEIAKGEPFLRDVQNKILLVLGLREPELLALLRELSLGLPPQFCLES